MASVNSAQNQRRPSRRKKSVKPKEAQKNNKPKEVKRDKYGKPIDEVRRYISVYYTLQLFLSFTDRPTVFCLFAVYVCQFLRTPLNWCLLECYTSIVIVNLLYCCKAIEAIVYSSLTHMSSIYVCFDKKLFFFRANAAYHSNTS